MSERIGIAPAAKPENTQHTLPNSAHKASEPFAEAPEKDDYEEESIKTEIITRTDIEIRKLHALRKAKEFLEERLADAAEKALNGVSIDASENESAAAMAYNAHSANSALQMGAVGTMEDTGSDDSLPSFKTGAAISGYKTYKKDTPKAWETGDMDEKR